MPRDKRRRRQRGGILPLLIPAAVLVAETTKRTNKQVDHETVMKRSCVNVVEIICKSIIMANCVAGVGRFLP